MKSRTSDPRASASERARTRSALRQDRHLGGRGGAALSERCARTPPMRRASSATRTWRSSDRRLIRRRTECRGPVRRAAGRVRSLFAGGRHRHVLQTRSARAITTGRYGVGLHSSGRRARFMLSVYVPRGTSLERQSVEESGRASRRRGLVRSRHADARRGQAGRARARHRGADARGDAGDRGLEPALCRERRALHDRDADVPVGHRDAQDHAGHLHPRRPQARHRALRRAASRSR